jgi:diguanylate cyclase (GGDEF)-like protein/PAS domain S-box-containing protein
MFTLNIFLLYVLREYLSLKDIFIITFLHSGVFIYRMSYLYYFAKKREDIKDTKTLHKWVKIFQSGSFSSGFVWGTFIFFLSGAPVEYTLLVLAIVVGLAAIAMATLGPVFSIYLSFMIPMMSLIFLWTIMHSLHEEFYTNTIVLLTLVTSYLFVSARRFEMTFHKSFTEEHRANFLKDRLELALDGSSTSIVDWNMLNDELFISESWKELLGFSGEKLPNRVDVWSKQIHKDDRRELFYSLKRHFKNKKESFESVHRLKKKDGEYIWGFAKAKIFYDKDDKPYRIIGTHTDVTQKKLIEADIIEKTKLFEESQRLAHIGSWKFDFSNNQLSWSDEIYRIFEIPKETKPSFELFLEKIHPQEIDEVKGAYKTSLKTQNSYEITYRLLFDDGRVKYVKEECETTFTDDATPIVSIGTAQDITKQKLLENMLHEQKEVMSHLAHHDVLTKLPNRILLNERLSKAIETAKQEDKKFAVLFIDLDHFKEINDSLGHDTGDEVLKEVAYRVKSLMGEYDTLARLGGDEFTVIMDDIKQISDVSAMAQNILDSLCEPVVVGENYFYLSCSIGISLYPDDGTTVQDLLKYADAAMYKAKEEGRSNFIFYSSEMTVLAFEKVLMEVNLRKALTNSEFEVYYQPQVNADKNTIIGMEALVRWNHPELGLVSPAKFIPIAESSGLIVKLDRYVMKSAIYQLKEWYDRGYNPGILALNLSMQQLKEKDFLDFTKALLKESGCQANWLEFEVTESHIMTNTKEAIEILTQLSKLGSMIAIDDFGTGYSSLSYLKRLPIDKLKIDRSFVYALPDEEEDVAIAHAVIALAKSLKLDIIAEGVENKRQKDFLVENGCENIQGYYFSRALKKEFFEEILIDGLPKH